MKWLLLRPARLMRVGAVACALAAAPAAARADQIDRVLVNDSAAVADKIAGLKAKHIAVLPFQVQVGSQPPTFKAGTEGLQLAHKLQNLLVLTNPTGTPAEYTVLGDAMKAAAAAGKAAGRAIDYTTPQGRQALLGLNLPVVWDAAAKHAPDTYLTGVLKLSPNLREAVVEIKAFSRSQPELRTVCKLAESKTAGIRVDRNTLADLGRTFAVAKSLGKQPATRAGRTKSVFGPDEAAADQVANGGPGVQPGGGAISVPNCPVELTVLVNGQPAPFTPDGSGNVRLNQTPPEGTELTFQMKNTGPEPVAVVLTIDGRNTVGLNPEERYDVNPNRESYRKWVLAPGTLYTIGGQLTNDSNGTWKKLVVDNEPSSQTRFLAMNPEVAGKIELRVFPANTAVVPDVSPAADPAANPGTAPGSGTPPADPVEQANESTELSNFEVLDKSLGRAKSASAAKSLVAAKVGVSVGPKASLKSLAAATPAPKGRTKGLAKEDGPQVSTGQQVNSQGFEPAASPSATIKVTYYSPEMVGQGGQPYPPQPNGQPFPGQPGGN